MSFPKRFTPHVTRHAMGRWIERAHGLEGVILDSISAEILRGHRMAWAAWGASRIFVPEHRVELVIKDGAVVTVQSLRHDGGSARR